jgi:hypothetical protein
MIKYTFFFFLLFLTKVEAQQMIELKNPSLEDVPASGKTPKSWENWGSPRESDVDIQPGQFDVLYKTYHGKTYVGMVVRDNDTYESIGQNLPYENRLMKGKKYKMSLYLAKALYYNSKSATTGKKDSYEEPAILKIWGRNSKTKKKNF